MARMVATSIKPSREILAENLTRILDERGRGSRSALAEKLGWHRTRITNILAAKQNFDTGTIDLLAEALDVDPWSLIQPE